jgi:uncharacterized protein (DUF952 family)
LLILHITRCTEWEAAQKTGVYSSADFEREGFIHASLVNQILESAERHYQGQTDLVLLGIDSWRVQAEIRFENLVGGSQQFPHIYGALNLDAVIGAAPLMTDETGHFFLPSPVQQWQQVAGSTHP